MHHHRLMATAGIIIASLALASATLASSPPPVRAGGCRVTADATISPGLTTTSQAFSYRYRGKLTGCAYTAPHAPTSGTITAGEVITIGHEQYQEPSPTGTGGCLGDTTSGYDFARWSDGTQTIVAFTTAASSTGDHLIGHIVSSLRLPEVGSPSQTAVFRSTRFVGQQAFGTLTFAPSNPSLCGTPQGITSATVSGVLVHVHS